MDTLAKLCSAIATAEGYFSPDEKCVPRRLNNPGDLMFAGQLGASIHHVTGGDKKVRPFAEFTRPELGVAALYRQVLKRIAEGATLRKLICDPVTGWAPAADGNDTNNYLLETMRRTGITDPDAPLLDFLELVHLP